ncbi:hypothetical protein [Chitinophaga sp. RAB17]|uniref:hypothetical protein n=1 Tax=Chitinophaga sp. RAB17 TaxID=3233049 RepID=UPI003F9202F3
MKRILLVLTAALSFTSCITDPPTTPIISQHMWYKETLCNDPWGKALTTSSDTVATWLHKQNIKYFEVSIYREIFPGAANHSNCDTFTNRLIRADIIFADTAKAKAAGFKTDY